MDNELKISNEKRPIILFDGYCNLCSGSVQFILRNEKSSYFFFSSLQSEFVKIKFPSFFPGETLPDSLILIENSKIYYRSDAALRIARKLKFPFWPLSYFRFLPEVIRDLVYNYIARNRYRFFGVKKSCYIPDEEYSPRFL